MSQNTSFNDYETEQVFPTIAQRSMRLNAGPVHREDSPTDLILLTIEDITEPKRIEKALGE